MSQQSNWRLLAWGLVGLVLAGAASAAWLHYERGHLDLTLDDLAILASLSAGSAVTIVLAARTRKPPLYGAFAGSLIYFLTALAWHLLRDGFRTTSLLGNYAIGLAWGLLLGLIVWAWRQLGGDQSPA